MRLDRPSVMIVRSRIHHVVMIRVQGGIIVTTMNHSTKLFIDTCIEYTIGEFGNIGMGGSMIEPLYVLCLYSVNKCLLSLLGGENGVER